MWRSKKFIIIALVAALVLVGGTVGVVAAQAKSGDDSQTGVTRASDNASQPKTLLARVASILGIDQQKVGDAVVQARTEMRDEALDNYLKNLVDQGKITQEQADQYKAWVKSKPDLSQYQQQLQEWQQARPGIPPELKTWEEARPGIPLPGGFGGRGFGGGMGLGGGRCLWDR
jgi:hypothetical protein